MVGGIAVHIRPFLHPSFLSLARGFRRTMEPGRTALTLGRIAETAGQIEANGLELDEVRDALAHDMFGAKPKARRANA